MNDLIGVHILHLKLGTNIRSKQTCGAEFIEIKSLDSNSKHKLLFVLFKQ